MNSVVFSICTFFKEEYLTKKLKTPNKSSIENYTFKKALVNFDRETDRFIIGKQLILEQNLNLDSFFHFKIKNLKEKWDELVNIANDNSTYFLAEDSFLELLKFLIDNIEYESFNLIIFPLYLIVCCIILPFLSNESMIVNFVINLASYPRLWK